MDSRHFGLGFLIPLASKGTRAFGAILLAVTLGLAANATEAVVAPDAGCTAYASTARPYDFKFTYTALLTGGKGSAYQIYSQMPGKHIIVYKARIKGGKLYVSGTMGRTKGGIVRLKNKAFKLTKKTKYYKHVGNGAFYEKITKKKMRKLLSNKTGDSGGDICIIVKKGKVTVLSAA